jgi:uncharacterized membrane protein (GlpM family)
MTQLIIKTVISLGIILAAITIGKRFPSLAGLISVMPLAGALILVWMYLDTRGDPKIMQQFTKGAIWGILPSILFYCAAFACFKKGFSLPAALAAGFAVWLAGALVHYLLLK